MRALEVETPNSELEPRPPAGGGEKTLPLLFEVGLEEIPARFLADAEKALGERVGACLREARLAPEAAATLGLETYSTPRRLVVHVPAVRAEQSDEVEEIIGPPVKVAVDSAGRYTRAAESFAQKNGARLEDLQRTTTPKGAYLCLQKTTRGRPAREILSKVLPAALLGLSFPKSMYWTAKPATRFVRPIRWVLALLGEGKHAETIGFEVFDVTSSAFTFGHRVKGFKPRRVTSFKDYSRKLAQAQVEIMPARRRKTLLEQAQALVEKAGAKLVQDELLVDWIVNSTEWPRPLLGSFDERFLHLPREILITVMRDHQKYFAVEDAEGNLRPQFVAVLNLDSDERGLIGQGHQRVLTARFRDAEFFWNADQRTRLADRVPLLGKVTFQAELGTYGDKVRRLLEIADQLCRSLQARGRLEAGQRAQVLRATELCKCDLTTQMVQEFPELQGVVGGLYAKAQGEDEAVAAAIYDHYLPAGAEGSAPRSLVGALVSLADKVDNVVGGFAAGHEPTGSSDPFALRRQANGLLKVLLEFSLDLRWDDLVHQASQCFPIARREPSGALEAKVMDFFRERLRFYLESLSGFRYDTVRAVLAAGSAAPLDALARAQAVEALRGGEDFEALASAAKRIRNILGKSASAADWEAGEVAEELLREPEEKELYETSRGVAAESGRLGQGRDYRRALGEISKLRPSVDRFFDQVLVMAEERQTRQNRLRLLKRLDELFSGIAHLAEIGKP